MFEAVQNQLICDQPHGYRLFDVEQRFVHIDAQPHSARDPLVDRNQLLREAGQIAADLRFRDVIRGVRS